MSQLELTAIFTAWLVWEGALTRLFKVLFECGCFKLSTLNPFFFLLLNRI